MYIGKSSKKIVKIVKDSKRCQPQPLTKIKFSTKKISKINKKLQEIRTICIYNRKKFSKNFPSNFFRENFAAVIFCKNLI